MCDHILQGENAFPAIHPFELGRTHDYGAAVIPNKITLEPANRLGRIRLEFPTKGLAVGVDTLRPAYQTGHHTPCLSRNAGTVRGLPALNTRKENPRPFSNGSTVAVISSTG